MIERKIEKVNIEIKNFVPAIIQYPQIIQPIQYEIKKEENEN